MKTWIIVAASVTAAAGAPSAMAGQAAQASQELAWSVGEQPDAVLAEGVVRAAAEYERRSKAASPAGADGGRGATAYGATVALKDAEFAASVRWLASDPMARKRIAARVLQNPAYAARFDPIGTAAAAVTTALQADAAPAVVSRSLALAALAVLGEAGDANAAAVDGLLTPPR